MHHPMAYWINNGMVSCCQRWLISWSPFKNAPWNVKGIIHSKYSPFMNQFALFFLFFDVSLEFRKRVTTNKLDSFFVMYLKWSQDLEIGGLRVTPLLLTRDLIQFLLILFCERSHDHWDVFNFQSLMRKVVGLLVFLGQ